jgi:hypothetical protein
MIYTYDMNRMIINKILIMDDDLIQERLDEAGCYKIERFDGKVLFYCYKELKDMPIHGVFFKQIRSEEIYVPIA